MVAPSLFENYFTGILFLAAAVIGAKRPGSVYAGGCVTNCGKHSQVLWHTDILGTGGISPDGVRQSNYLRLICVHSSN
jgi:hypothetical protein